MRGLQPFLILAGLAALPAAALAQSAPVPSAAQPIAGDTVRLTDAQRDAVLDQNTVESAEAARGEMTGADRAKLEIHGEVGAFVGSHDSRGVYGTAAVPLGDHAGAVVSFESEQIRYSR